MLKISPLETQLQSAIAESLQNHLISNAVFLSERLYYENKSDENLSLLCESLLMENRHYKIYSLLKESKFPKNQYLFGVACLRLKKLDEAQDSFQNCLSFNYNPGFSSYMLGLCHEKQINFKEACSYYMKALEHKPTLWTAYEHLCNLGCFVSPSKIFNERRKTTFPNTLDNIEVLTKKNKVEEKPHYIFNIFGQSDYSKKTSLDFEEDEEYQNKVTSSSFVKFVEAPGEFTQGFEANLTLNSTSHSNLTQKALTTNLKPNAKSDSNPNSNLFPLTPSINYNEITNFLCLFAFPCFHLSKYQTREALNFLKKLPSKHYNSGWAQFQIAKCYMELRDYSTAEDHFKRTLEFEPHHTESMSYYSSCLWQLKKDVDLAYLAHKALKYSKLESDSWVVMGNCYSRQKEHENAIKCFKRAIVLRADNSYAFCLCGFESGYLEDLENAKNYFENSLALNNRNCNAWWGLGHLYFKTENYDKSIEVFQKAISINPNNPTLLAYLGMAFNSKRIFGEGLKCFDKALELDDKNHIARFQKANALFQLQQYDMALGELEKLRLLMPEESIVVKMMSKIYMKTGNQILANKFLNITIALEPILSQKVKEETGVIEANFV